MTQGGMEYTGYVTAQTLLRLSHPTLDIRLVSGLTSRSHCA